MKICYVLSCVQKYDIIRTNNLQIVTSQGTKNGSDNPRISEIKGKYDYPNPIKQNNYIVMHQYVSRIR